MIDFDKLQNLVPSAFATSPASHVSENYQFVRTADVLKVLDNNGWEVQTARQQKVRKAERALGTKHTITLRKSGVPAMRPDLGGLFPTINLTNSNDWSSRLSMAWGIFRVICSNGAIAGTVYDSYNVKHDQIRESIESVLERFTSASNKLIGDADMWSQRLLDKDEVSRFTMAAARIRFGEEANSDQATALNMVRRPIDELNSLWNVFNRVQENAMQGGNRVGTMSRRIRAISNIAAEKEINQGLFDLAHSFA